MNYLLSDLNEIDKNELQARLLFDVATAKGSELPLVKFILNKGESEKNQKALLAALRALKKKGKITFFVSSLDFSGASTEAEYLFNKFPELKAEQTDEKTVAYFVKI